MPLRTVFAETVTNSDNRLSTVHILEHNFEHNKVNFMSNAAWHNRYKIRHNRLIPNYGAAQMQFYTSLLVHLHLATVADRLTCVCTVVMYSYTEKLLIAVCYYPVYLSVHTGSGHMNNLFDCTEN